MKTQITLSITLFLFFFTSLNAQFNDTVLDQLLASDGSAGNAFGHTVAIDGDRIVIGAPNKSPLGAVYVYDLVGGNWQETIITPFYDPTQITGVYNVYFGWDVAVDGDRIVVGATDELCTLSGWGPGTVYVYDKVGSNWLETVILGANSPTPDDESFGWSVDIDGNRIVVGAPRDDGPNIGVTDQLGAAFVFDFVGGFWQETKIIPNNGMDYDNFGWDVAVEGNRVIVGAINKTVTTCGGSIYIYDLVGGTWQKNTELWSSDAMCGEQFGHSVALSPDGNTIVSGAPYQPNGTPNRQGSVYVYDGNNNWQETKIVSSDISNFDDFGWSVDLDGNDKLVVGTMGADKTYLYQLGGTVWSETILTAFDDDANFDQFGQAVALDGGKIIIGSRWDTNANGTQAGSAYIYDCISNCQANVYVFFTTIPNGTYQAQFKVSSDQTVPSGGNVVFDGGTEVLLLPGFEVSTMAIFCAIIGGCTP